MENHFLPFLANNFKKDVALPSNWTITQQIPNVPNQHHQVSQQQEEEFSNWVDEHLGTKSRVGKWFKNEDMIKERETNVTVPKKYLMQLWKNNGGNLDRSFGVIGSFTPSKKNNFYSCLFILNRYRISIDD